MRSCYYESVDLSHFPRPLACAVLLLSGSVAGSATGCGEATNTNAIPPLADAGPDFLVGAGETVTLDASNSVDGTVPIDGYAWTLTVSPEGSNATLSAADSAVVTFVPDVLGIYIVSLVVSADGQASRPDVVLVTADVLNQPPGLVLGCLPNSNCEVLHGQTAQLNAQLSSDPEGDPFTVTWSQITVPADCGLCPNLNPCAPSSASAPLDDPTQLLARFTAPNARDLSLVFRAEANDGRSASSACITYTTVNTTPTAQLAAASGITNPEMVDENTAFTLDAGASFDADPPDDASLAFTWTQVSGPTVTIADPSLEAISLTAPDVAGTLPSVDVVFSVSVSDGIDADSAQITVSVQNL
ncbi:MAG: hypothetical protein AAF654_01510 [Myxococcota bacterium]